MTSWRAAETVSRITGMPPGAGVWKNKRTNKQTNSKTKQKNDQWYLEVKSLPLRAQLPNTTQQDHFMSYPWQMCVPVFSKPSAYSSCVPQKHNPSPQRRKRRMPIGQNSRGSELPLELERKLAHIFCSDPAFLWKGCFFGAFQEARVKGGHVTWGLARS